MSDTDPPDTIPALTPAQQAAVDAAAAYVNTTERDDAYQHFVDPAGTKTEEQQVAHAVSACMLLAATLLGWVGRFVGDTIQVILAKLWVQHGGGRVPDVDNFVSEGGQVWWRANPATGAEEHVDGCVERVVRTSLYHVTLHVIAAGQRVVKADVDAGAFTADRLGLRCCKRVVREVTWSGSAWVDDGDQRSIRMVLDAT